MSPLPYVSGSRMSPVEPDAMVFDVASMKGFVIKEDADYEGVRVTFRGTLQNMRIPMQIDIGSHHRCGARWAYYARMVSFITFPTQFRDCSFNSGTIKRPTCPVSKIERRKDVKLSTLRDYVKSIGGSLEVLARLPGGVVRAIELDDEQTETPPSKSIAAGQ
jgi:hypothetical protein